MPRKAVRAWVWLQPEDIETLEDLRRVANLPDSRAEQIRFAIRLLRWTYGSEIGSLMDMMKDVRNLLKTLIEYVTEENESRGRGKP